jgi:ATP-binding cassette subfamily B (MDR/TAP) protein 1
MLSTVPPIIIAGAIVSKLMTGLSTRMQADYSDAGNVVEQTLGAIRMVSATRKHFLFLFIYPFPIITSNFLISCLPGLSVYAYLKVVSFNGENQAITKYNTFIRKAYQSSLQEGVVNGLGFGLIMAILFSSYGLAVWYGSKLIVERGYNGGMVISVIMAIIMGAM